MRESTAHGHLQLGLAGQGGLRWALTDLTDVVEAARQVRDLSPLAAVALGQMLAGAALVARMVTKTPARLVLEARGDGPLGRVLADVDDQGNLRGMVEHPQAATAQEGVDLEVRSALGAGTLRVIRQMEKGNYESHVELVEGGVSQNLAHYLEKSEQIHSAVLLGVLARPSGIAAAGGLILEALPGVDEDVLSALEARVGELSSVSRVLEEGGPQGLLRAAVNGLDVELLESRQLRLSCHCDRERFRQQILGLSAADREHLQVHEGTTETECAFCGRKYVFTAEELSAPQ